MGAAGRRTGREDTLSCLPPSEEEDEELPEELEEELEADSDTPSTVMLRVLLVTEQSL